jgi:hypothetical protein
MLESARTSRNGSREAVSNAPNDTTTLTNMRQSKSITETIIDHLEIRILHTRGTISYEIGLCTTSGFERAWTGHRGSLFCIPKESSIDAVMMTTTSRFHLSMQRIFWVKFAWVLFQEPVSSEMARVPVRYLCLARDRSADEIVIYVSSRGNMLTVVPGGNRRRHKISRATAVT